MSDDMKKVILARLATIAIPGIRTDPLTAGLINPDDVTYEDGKCIVPVNVPDSFDGD